MTHRRGIPAPSLDFAAAFTAMVGVAAFIAWPLAAALLGDRAPEPDSSNGFAPDLLARTVGTGLVIAILATLAGLPGAWLIRRKGWAWSPLVALPMLTPAYLASSGFNILRAPGTWTGDWLGELSRGGSQWPTLVAGRVLAILGLSLWVSPLPAMFLGAGLRTLDDDTLDAFSLDSGPLRRFIGVLVACRGFVLAALVLVTVMMMGSAVPLHLAQMKTTALLAWLTLQETGSVRAAAVACAPLSLAAAGVGAWAAGVLCQAPIPESITPAITASRRSGWFLGAWVVVPGVLVPAALFVSQVRSVGAMQRFWMEAGHSLASSGLVAAVVATVCASLSLAVWRIRSPWALRALVAAFVAAALVPGVLVGCAWRMAWPSSWPDSRVIVALAHSTRFGVFGVLGGLLLKRLEDETTRNLMRVDGVSTFTGWWKASGIRLFGAWALAAAVAGVFSLHEIEAAVVVQPAGVMSLPQRLLNDLHQLRMEAMSAAALWLLTIGLGVAALALLANGWAIGGTKPSGRKTK